MSKKGSGHISWILGGEKVERRTGTLHSVRPHIGGSDKKGTQTARVDERPGDGAVIGESVEGGEWYFTVA